MCERGKPPFGEFMYEDQPVRLSVTPVPLLLMIPCWALIEHALKPFMVIVMLFAPFPMAGVWLIPPSHQSLFSAQLVVQAIIALPVVGASKTKLSSSSHGPFTAENAPIVPPDPTTFR